MELKNYLINLLSGIIQDRLAMLNDAKKTIKKANEFKKVEAYFTDASNIVNVDEEELRKVLTEITDEDTIDGIISNIQMIKIVEAGIADGLDLSLDDSQIALIDGVYELVNNYISELEDKNREIKKSLEDFILKCERLSNDISTGVVRDLDTLNEIFIANDVALEDIVKSKYEILKNNNKNYNLNLDSKVKEEIDLRINLNQIGLELDSFSNLEKDLLISNVNILESRNLLDLIESSQLVLKPSELFILLLFSNYEIVSNLIDISNKYSLEFLEFFRIPGIFVNDKSLIENIVNEYSGNEEYYTIKYIENIGCDYDNFVKNIDLMSYKGYDVTKCFKSNILAFVIPDMEKNITILEGMNLTIEEFSVVVINPYLATSKSSFNECGLGEYLKNNPLRLCTSYFRLKSIASNIVDARKNGKIIFRSLSDKKNYWLAKSITKGEEVINNVEVS